MQGYRIYECTADTYHAVELNTGLPAMFRKGEVFAVRNGEDAEPEHQILATIELKGTRQLKGRNGKKTLRTTNRHYLVERIVFQKCFKPSEKWIEAPKEGGTANG